MTRPCCPTPHRPTTADLLARGEAAARADRYGSDAATVDFHAGFVGVKRAQTRMETACAPDPELIVDPALIGGPV